ncbi:MAG TPA: hypothetical protein VGD61_12450 [Pyrinomonadaceae bacterium]
MNTHKLAGAVFAVTSILLIAASSASKSAAFQKVSVTKVVHEKTLRTFNCHRPNEYKLVMVENPTRHKDSDSSMPRDLNIVVGDKVISAIELPKADTEAKNFSLNSVKKNKGGFKINVDWGGSLYHYYIQFNFRCRQNDFYLYRVKKISFLTTNPESGRLWDKREVKILRPNLPIKKFGMTAYL